MRNLFLSFLGTNHYIPCNYHPEHEPERAVANVNYVQQAMIQLYCSHYTPSDNIVVFTTKDAKRMNWDDDGQYNRQTGQHDLSNQGLANTLVGMSLAPSCQQVDIVEGFSETEIWDIFQTVYDVLQPGDKVIFDITHAFRSLPMLGMSLIHYAKAMKAIEVVGVYYGAFEKLGPAHMVRNMPLAERNAPILNLKAFSDLQDWTTAGQDFVRYGISNRWQQLTQSEIQPILAESRGQNLQAKDLRFVAKGIGDLTANIQSNRGESIMEIPTSPLPQKLEEVLRADDLIKPLRPILEQVETKLAPLTEAKELVWLAAVKWCIDHKMTQQGITQLQEGLLTWFCQQLAAENSSYREFFNWEKEAPRNILSAVLSLCKLETKPAEEAWGGDLAAHPDVTRFLFDHELILAWAPRYNSLTQLRNAINHGGYTDNLKANHFAKKLQAHYHAVNEELKA